MENWRDVFLLMLIAAIPVTQLFALALFLRDAIAFLLARRAERKEPGSDKAEEKGRRRRGMIASGIVFAAFTLVLVVMIWVFFRGLSMM